jgi:hypothetical protein
MNPSLSRGVVVLSCAALCACTTLRTLPIDATSDGRGSTTTAIKPEDRLTITLKTGEVYRLTSATKDATAIVGIEDSEDARMSIPLDQVAKIERLERDVARTVGLVVGIVLASILFFHWSIANYGVSTIRVP